MWRYVLRRSASSIALLAGVAAITFALFFQLPNEPGEFLIGPPSAAFQTTAGKKDYLERLARANHELGVDRPLTVQYLRYLERLAHGDLGRSFQTRQPVRDMLGPSARITAALVLGGLAVVVLLALPLGILGALHVGGLLDRGLTIAALVGASVPPFLISYFLLHWLSTRLPVATGSGYCPLLGTATSSPSPGAPAITCGGAVDWARHLLLPWLAFGLGLVALYSRMVRSGVLDLLGEPHVLVARAKGASDSQVLRRHVLRNALPPLLAMLSMDIGMALGTAVYVEIVFGLQGLGLQAYGAVVAQWVGFDLPVIAGVVLIAAVVIVVLNLVVDLLCATLDPRIRLSGTSPRG